MAETGIDALAVNIGQVHLHGREKVSLDLDRLTRLKSAVGVPLVLHGATSVDRGHLVEAIRRGIRKINVGSILKQTYFQELRAACRHSKPDANPYEVIGSGLPEDVLIAGRVALQKAVEDMMQLFGSADRAKGGVKMIDQIVMPSMGATGEDVVIAEWLVKEGDFVKEGQQIFVAETDKATTEVEAFRAGYIRKILVQARESAALGDALAIIADSLDEPLEDAAVATPPPAGRARPPATAHAAVAVLSAGRPSSSFSLGPPTRQGAWNRSGDRKSRWAYPQAGRSQCRDPQAARAASSGWRFPPCDEPSPCERSRARRRRPISTLRPAST